MTDINYSKRKGVADEAHWNEFIAEAGGELISPHIARQGVKNADYMFKKHKIIAELKIFETEFAHTNDMLRKVDALSKQYPPGTNDSGRLLDLELIKLWRKPLQRTVNKANRQIKETKKELGLTDWRGVLICVNDNFRKVPPPIVLGLLNDIISGTSYTNTHAIIYQTNHFIELPSSPYAHLLWTALYAKGADDSLIEFIETWGALGANTHQGSTARTM